MHTLVVDSFRKVSTKIVVGRSLMEGPDNRFFSSVLPIWVGFLLLLVAIPAIYLCIFYTYFNSKTHHGNINININFHNCKFDSKSQQANIITDTQKERKWANDLNIRINTNK